MSDISYGQIARNGFWDANPGLAQLLGLCPTLAVTATVVNAVGLGLATTLVLMASNVTVSMIRNVVPNEVRIPVFVLVIAAFVTVVQMLMHAYFYDLYKVLGIFVPLIVTNCIIIGRAEAFASKHSVSLSLFDGVAMGLGFTATLVVLGAMREIVGRGTIFGNAQVMFGEWAKGLTTTLIPHYNGYLIAILPPGAFLGLGLLVALKNVIDRRAEARRKAAATAPADQTATA